MCGTSPIAEGQSVWAAITPPSVAAPRHAAPISHFSLLDMLCLI